jgi:hypothetical protein
MTPRLTYYLLLNILTIVFLFLSYFLSVHFIWPALICFVIITLGTCTGWTLGLNLNRHPNNVLELIEEISTSDSPRSFASYQKLRQRPHEQQIKSNQ